MLDYKDIIIKHYGLGLSGSAISKQLGVSKSGVNDFIRAFERCDKLSYPLPAGITNYGIAELVYGASSLGCRNEEYELPDYGEIHLQLTTRKNMTMVFLWNRYKKRCSNEGKKYYQYRQFCERYQMWIDENKETLHLISKIGETMEIDFAGKTFKITDPITTEVTEVVIFVAILPYSQYIYAEGMTSTKEPQWISVNNNALEYFGGVPLMVVCDNCKQAVTANKDWIEPDLNKDFAAWAEHNGTVILPAKVRHPKYKSSVENAVGILEKGIFLELEERRYFTIDQFNFDLHAALYNLNHSLLKNRDYSRSDTWEEEKHELMPLPSVQYQYTERKQAKVSSDFHIRFDNAYYSVDKAYLHQYVFVNATTTTVKIYSKTGDFICEWPRATRRGEWKTNQAHLPENSGNYSEWNSSYFISMAMTVGPNTVELIKAVLTSRKYEVQTYRLCVGILNYRKSYSKSILEECCRQALEMNHPTYTFVKNTIAAIASEHSKKDLIQQNNARNKNAYVMGSDAYELDHLLSKSSDLAKNCSKDGDRK